MKLGVAIDQLYKLREERAALEKQVRDLKQRQDEMEINVTHLLNEQNVSMSRGESATVSITSSVVPAVEDWDNFYDHIKATGDFHLLERRPSAAAYRELLDSGEDVPGLKPFVKRKLSLRKN